MKRARKSTFPIVALLIVAFALLAFFGISTRWGDLTTTYIKGGSNVRWGIDIRGGVDATFTPPESVTDVTDEQMNSAETIIKTRLVSANITDYEVYTDSDRNRIIVRFPWKEDEENFDPESAIQELGAMANLTFREGSDYSGEVILSGTDVVSATAVVQENQSTKAQEYAVSLELTPEGGQKFADATGRLVNQQIGIWMDETLISAPNVNEQINDGKAQITGNFTAEEVQDLADKINAGALPFALEISGYSTVDPSLGAGARDAMLIAGLIAFVAICLFMIFVYRLPGAVACIALVGQVAGTVAALTGFFPVFNSFTLTLPGIAGIVLAVGMGVDANVITSERIREELHHGKSIDGALTSGFQRALTAILDGNLTTILIAIILMGAFGPSSSIFARVLSFVFRWFGQTTTGAIYSFGYTLMVGVILNFIMGVTASRLMLRSLSQYKALRKPWLYGGEKA